MFKKISTIISLCIMLNSFHIQSDSQDNAAFGAGLFTLTTLATVGVQTYVAQQQKTREQAGRKQELIARTYFGQPAFAQDIIEKKSILKPIPSQQEEFDRSQIALQQFARRENDKKLDQMKRATIHQNELAQQRKIKNQQEQQKQRHRKINQQRLINEQSFVESATMSKQPLLIKYTPTWHDQETAKDAAQRSSSSHNESSSGTFIPYEEDSLANSGVFASIENTVADEINEGIQQTKETPYFSEKTTRLARLHQKLYEGIDENDLETMQIIQKAAKSHNDLNNLNNDLQTWQNADEALRGKTRNDFNRIENLTPKQKEEIKIVKEIVENIKLQVTKNRNFTWNSMLQGYETLSPFGQNLIFQNLIIDLGFPTQYVKENIDTYLKDSNK